VLGKGLGGRIRPEHVDEGCLGQTNEALFEGGFGKVGVAACLPVLLEEELDVALVLVLVLYSELRVWTIFKNQCCINDDRPPLFPPSLAKKNLHLRCESAI